MTDGFESKGARPRLRPLCVLMAVISAVAGYASEGAPLVFDVDETRAPRADVPVIQPWKSVLLDRDYGGLWVVAGDLDGDGVVEIVSAENFNQDDVHFTSAAAAQRLDGTVLWRWGDPDIGRKKWHHDVACQIHDWDGDGKNEVVLGTKGALVELDGATGQERRRLPIPDEAADCLVFCDLTGKGRPTDVLVKDRYRRIWAYDRAGALLWTVANPGGYLTAHQPRPMDLDNDGRDEVMAGYAMLNADGSVRWVYQSKAVDQSRGHLDCVRVARQGKAPEDVRLVLTCCGANNLACVDGTGRVLWEVSGHHFESVDIGRVVPGHPGFQVVVDIDHGSYGEGPVWVLDEEGKLLGRIMTDYARHHVLLDWNGDGLDEIVVAHHGGLYGHSGQRIGTFALPVPETDIEVFEASVLTGDMSGDGIPDVMITTPEAVYIYRNEKGRKPEAPAPPGTEFNFTLY